MRRTGPSAVDSESSRWSGNGLKSGIILQEKYQRFSALRCRERMLRAVRLYVELDIGRTATWSAQRVGLRRCREGRGQEKNHESSTHQVPV